MSSIHHVGWWEAPQTSYPPGEDYGGGVGALEESETGRGGTGASGRAVTPLRWRWEGGCGGKGSPRNAVAVIKQAVDLHPLSWLLPLGGPPARARNSGEKKGT